METAFARRSVQAPLEFYYCAVMAEAFAAEGRQRDAFDIVARTLERAATSQAGLLVPELWRLKGELTLALSADERAEAERCLDQAVAMAERQGARLLELRATTSLRTHLGRNGTAGASACPARAALSRFRRRRRHARPDAGGAAARQPGLVAGPSRPQEPASRPTTRQSSIQRVVGYWWPVGTTPFSQCGST